MSDLDAVYAERNQLAIAFASVAGMLGCRVGYLTDENEPDWPVLVVDTPQGQVSWHVKRDELPDALPAYQGEWDGHTTTEKYERLAAIVAETWRPRPRVIYHKATLTTRSDPGR